MRYILFLLVAMLQMPLLAQGGNSEADALLDKVVAGIKAAAPVQMDYTYTVYDDESQLVQADKGVIFIDNDRYALLMEFMKVWCDGSTQWSYMREINEIYVTEASSDEAQNLSPLYVMEYYREGYEASMADKGDRVAVKLQAADSEADVESVELFITKESDMLVAMSIYMPSQGRIEVELDGYTPHCGVGSDAFVCPEADFPDTEIIDMR